MLTVLGFAGDPALQRNGVSLTIHMRPLPMPGMRYSVRHITWRSIPQGQYAVQAIPHIVLYRPGKWVKTLLGVTLLLIRQCQLRSIKRGLPQRPLMYCRQHRL
jgi:hypothetical protein